MRRILIGIFCCVAAGLSAQVGVPDWENHQVLHINREPARAAFFPYGEHVGDRRLCLDGSWKFRWTPMPEERIPDFYRTDYDDSVGWSFPYLPIGKLMVMALLSMFLPVIRLKSTRLV